MNQEERRRRLIEALKAEREEYAGIVVPTDERRLRDQVRVLLNVRPPAPASEELLAAREHPEQYGHLRVRVSGFSGTFTLLEESIQDDIMRRTHQSD